MFKGILKDNNGDELMEQYGDTIYDIEFYEDFIQGILKDGGSVELKYVGELQTCESAEGFI